MKEVTLTEILEVRENRVRTQKSIISKYRCPIISFTMNMAGPIKYTPAVERAFWEGLSMLKSRLKEFSVLCLYVNICHTGCEAIIAIDEDAQKLKELCVFAEESSALGRLFDMDVIDADGKKLTRKNIRCCMVCGAPGRECSAGRLHSVTGLKKVTDKIIMEYFINKDSKTIASLAVKSLIDEVNTTPKPGLVDKNNNGSHADMTRDTFVKSALCLEKYFQSAFLTGLKNKDADKCFAILRCKGTEAETAMYETTGGVNTHKGIIYSMGILCACAGRVWKLEKNTFSCSQLLLEASVLVQKSVQADFEVVSGKTAGERLYINHGIRGIRGEAALGFPSLRDIALPVYTKALEMGESSNDAGVRTLIHLIAKVEDTNLYNRGGINGAQFAARLARDVIKRNPDSFVKDAKILDREFIRNNLSPGGCADLLALTYFLTSIAI